MPDPTQKRPDPCSLFASMADWVCDCGKSPTPADDDWRWTGSNWEHFHGYPIGHVAAKMRGTSHPPEQTRRIPEPLADERRAEFEKWISPHLFGRSVNRFPDDPANNAWPNQYRDDDVQLAWDAWREALIHERKGAIPQ